MGDNEATLLLRNGAHIEGKDLSVSGQPLHHAEIQLEGHSWYINQNYEHRDASFEEILHLVHDTGIGVDGTIDSGTDGQFRGAEQTIQFQNDIREAQANAQASSLWPLINGQTENSQTEEWRKENSLSQEYLAAVIDVYYGL